MADAPKLMTPDEALQAIHEMSLKLLAIAEEELKRLQAKEHLDASDVRRLPSLVRCLREIRPLFETKGPRKQGEDDPEDDELGPSEFIERLLGEAEGPGMAEKVHAARNGN